MDECPFSEGGLRVEVVGGSTCMESGDSGKLAFWALGSARSFSRRKKRTPAGRRRFERWSGRPAGFGRAERRCDWLTDEKENDSPRLYSHGRVSDLYMFPGFKGHLSLLDLCLWVKTRYPKWHPGKWKQ